MTGRIHSFQSLGTVDGPGVRCVVFFQGCPLRCICCHNPDTWSFDGGEETDCDALVKKILRFRSYFGTEGGVTVSGGEPLMQAAFVAELFAKLKAEGIHTALDTSGCVFNADIEELLKFTDLVLLDFKYQNEDDYFNYTKCHLSAVEYFLGELEKRGIDTWLRRVIIPGKSDDEVSVSALNALAENCGCVKRVELLPFRDLCREKYENLGIPFPLAGTPVPSKETMDRLNSLISPGLR